MRGRACHDLHFSGLLVTPQSADQILLVAHDKCVMHAQKQPVVHFRQRIEGGQRSSPCNFFFRKLDSPLQFLQVTRLQQRVEQHGTEGRR